MQHRLTRFSLLIILLILAAGCGVEKEAPAGEMNEEVATYVGDESCASCHEDIYASYRKTGMGKSVSLFDPVTAPEQFSEGIEVYNERFDYYYTPFVHGDTLYQKEYRKDDAGNVIYERTYAVDWVIGSGNATRSYLMNANGYITQMPLTWYVDKQHWDMSPAYEQHNFRFERPITQECMTCHNGLPEYTPFTQNHYESIPLGISCERCHGPGSEHEDLRLAGLGGGKGEPDETIVNPVRLDRERELAVCQQCHLTGTSVFGPGKDMTTFKPGDLLEAHRTVFVVEERISDPESFGISSHAQRLARSACYESSNMTCVTCHDPHQPVAELGENHFNEACISCHTPAENGGPIVCNRADFAEPAEAMTGNCIGCHLQKSGTSDIPHVTFTDHWIRRTVPPSRPATSIDENKVRSTPFNLVRVESERAENDPDGMLEEAIAYFHFYDTEHRHESYLPKVIASARSGLAAGADHPEARLVLARALMEMDSLESAQRILDDAVQQYSEDAAIYLWLGEVRSRTQDVAGAIAAYKRAVELAPAMLQARLRLASAYSAAQQLEEAEVELRRVVDANPVHTAEAWNNLGFVYLQRQQLTEAGEMFDRALDLDPDLVTAWANAGSVQLMQQQFDEAQQKFERALEIDPTYVAALGNLSLIYREQGKMAEAKELLRRLLTFQPNDPNARALLRELEGQ